MGGGKKKGKKKEIYAMAFGASNYGLVLRPPDEIYILKIFLSTLGVFVSEDEVVMGGREGGTGYI